MKIKFKLNKKGVTILEGLIAMTLLSIVAVGSFAVLLSTSRKTSSPDIREEMIFAIEKTHNMLQAYVVADGLGVGDLPSGATGLCGGDNNPFGVGTHAINCLLPPICDIQQSSFSYQVEESGTGLGAPLYSQDTYKALNSSGEETGGVDTSGQKYRKITYSIRCNGFTL